MPVSIDYAAATSVAPGAALTPLTKLENLNFHSCLVNDAGLAEVGTLSSLERLEIAGALPRTPSGKIQKFMLRDHAADNDILKDFEVRFLKDENSPEQSPEHR